MCMCTRMCTVQCIVVQYNTMQVGISGVIYLHTYILGILPRVAGVGASCRCVCVCATPNKRSAKQGVIDDAFLLDL